MQRPLISLPLQVRPSLIGGRGIFAVKKIKKGEVIEECPVLLFTEECPSLNNYYFNWTEDPPVKALTLGHGLIYNHSDTPNAKWEINPDEKIITFKALYDISADDEIFISYGNKWFEARDMIVKFYKYKRIKRIISIVIKTAIVALALLGLQWFIVHLKGDL